MKHFFLFALIILCTTSCNSQRSAKQLDAEWSKVSADQVIKNLDEFEKQVARADSSDGLRSLLIIKDDQILFEKYFNGHKENRKHHVRSVTKSFIALLVGIAIDKELISSVDQPIKSFLQEYPAQEHRSKLDSLTIRHLLTMSSGYQWDESSGTGYVFWYDSPDKINYLLERPLVAKAGDEFEYNSAAVHVLSVVLEKAIDQPLMDFAKTNLFDPLRISMADVAYQQDERGFVNGGAGLELRARDMAKLGAITLNKGKFRGVRIVSENWITESMEMHMPFPAPEREGRLYTRGYGYLWWLVKVLGEDGWLAWGWGGQFIMVLPSSNTMIITNNYWNVNDQKNSAQVNSTFRIMIGILESMK